MKTKLFALILGALTLAGCAGRFYSGGDEKGDPGDPGLPGSDGKDGLSAFDRYLEEHPDYPGDEKEWLDDLASGLLETGQELDINEYAEITGGNAALLSVNSQCVELNVKEYYKGSPVTTIAANAGIFASESVEKITVSKYVEYIGREAFSGFDCLTELALGERVSFIDDDAFSGCDALETVNFPDSIARLGEYCFTATAIKSFVCPSSLTIIPTSCFSYCYDLEEVVLHDRVEEICSRAFSRTGFSSIFIPSSVQTIESGAFGQYLANTTIYCEAPSKPDGWANDWASSDSKLNVVWGASRP